MLSDPTVQQTVPVVIVESDGTFYVVHIPQMSEQAFKFMMKLLDMYELAIVIKDSTADTVQPETDVTPNEATG